VLLIFQSAGAPHLMFIHGDIRSPSTVLRVTFLRLPELLSESFTSGGGRTSFGKRERVLDERRPYLMLLDGEPRSP